MEIALVERLHHALRSTFAEADSYPNEKAFERAFATALGDTETSRLRATFAQPMHPAMRPPRSAIDELGRREVPIVLPPEGRDPCVSVARLDVLWNSEAGAVPIELKYRTKHNSDVYGYAFLKDLHRLERMVAVGKHLQLSDHRFAIFVTTESVYWEGRRPEPRPFWLTEGRRLGPREWIQYDQKAAHTLWYQYAPFYLANRYQLRWHDLGRPGRYLLVHVQPQGQTSS